MRWLDIKSEVYWTLFWWTKNARWLDKFNKVERLRFGLRF